MLVAQKIATATPLAALNQVLVTPNQIEVVPGIAFLCHVLRCTPNLPRLATHYGPSPAEDVGFI